MQNNPHHKENIVSILLKVFFSYNLNFEIINFSKRSSKLSNLYSLRTLDCHFIVAFLITHLTHHDKQF